jgi:hypothetical protein
VFLNCNFPQALVANGYPYDVGSASTSFMRPWGQNGMTAIINCAVGSQISAAGWTVFGSGTETTCRAREYGTTLIGGGTVNVPQVRWNAGTYWVNTLDPDYTNNPSLSPTDPLLAVPTGTNNRVVVTINTNSYTILAIFTNAYFGLNGWLPTVIPTITSQPTNQLVNSSATAVFTVAATGLPNPSFQWLKNGTNFLGATNAVLTITNVQAGDAATYSAAVSNSAGVVTSSNAILTVFSPNTVPSLAPISDQTTNAGAMITITNIATDPDVPPQILTFSLLAGPTDSTFSAAGVFNWRAAASQSGSTNPVSVKVTDNGTPNLSATNNFKVIVNPASKPSLGSVSFSGNQLSITVNGGTVGPDYVVEVSSNLTDWQTLVMSNTPPEPFLFTDTNNQTAPAKYYRIKLSP